MWQSIIGTVLGVALAALLIRRMLNSAEQRKAWPRQFFAEAMDLLEDPSVTAGTAAGTAVLTGRYLGTHVQIKAVTDTLALRKLPSLWLMVTLPVPVPVAATIDLMMRPEASTSFSNFDQLDYTIQTPDDFPIGAVIRTDDPSHVPSPLYLKPHLTPFYGRQAKELLISPKGLRIVMLLAEADRARYGVFRQADFGEVRVSPELLKDCLERLHTLREDIENWHTRVS